MSYGIVEGSPEHGSPITLYEFRTGPRNVDVYRLTDADQDIDLGNQSFLRETIARTDLQTDGSLKKQKITISVPMTNEVAKLFLFYPPSYVVTVKILEGHFRDEDEEFITIMSGRVLSLEQVGVEARLTCEPASTSLRRLGLRRNYQRQCPLPLYGDLCRAVREPVACQSGIISGNLITVSPNSPVSIPKSFTGGIAEWVNSDNGRTELRTILSCEDVSGDLRLRLAGPIRDVPDTIEILKGCAHTETACKDWHDNILNFGGQPWIPLNSPFGKVSEFF